jgi:transglutaminase-like putative cysteine protease
MNRRDFLKYTSLVPALSLAPVAFSAAGAAGPEAAPGAGWRRFEHITKVTLDPSRGKSKLWLPVPTHIASDYQLPIESKWKGNYAKAGLFRELLYGSEALYAEWDAPKEPMQIELTSPVFVRDRAVDLGKPQAKPAAIPDDVAFYLKGTPSSPTDGIVLTTAQKIAKTGDSPIEKAQAVYDWILENGVRDPNVTGCGTGDVVAMLETGNISGKGADLNGLFVALVRSLGVPARDVYGIRVADSRYFKSLGKSGDISKSQHCKAEFYVAEHGWIPVDPADVLKVSLEERVPMESPQVASERRRQFGNWEGNWITYNTARDVKLNPPAKAEVEFLMYPRSETAQGVLNHLDPKTFQYEITSREVVA